MIRTDALPGPSTVSSDEIARRVAEYRRQGYESQAMPHGVYREPFIVCPWPGCAFRIVAVDFQIEKSNDPTLDALVINAWWRGDGIAGRCPGCGQFVLFSMDDKKPVADPVAAGLTILPDDWHLHAYIVS